jgi:hypothetical protein
MLAHTKEIRLTKDAILGADIYFFIFMSRSGGMYKSSLNVLEYRLPDKLDDLKAVFEFYENWVILFFFNKKEKHGCSLGKCYSFRFRIKRTNIFRSVLVYLPSQSAVFTQPDFA